MHSINHVVFAGKVTLSMLPKLTIFKVVLAFCTTQTLTAVAEGHLNFVLTQGSFGSGAIIESITANSLQECLGSCLQAPTCNAVNFRRIPVRNSAPECQLISERALFNSTVKIIGNSTSYINAGGYMYYAETVCLPTGITVAHSKLLIDGPSVQTREECLVSCLKSSDCRAAIYKPATSMCHLSWVNRHTVKHFKEYFLAEEEVEMFETNCREEPRGQCHFLLRKNDGMNTLYDQRRTGVRTALDCQAMCLEFQDAICRSYTFDDNEHLCYLSHISPLTLNDQNGPGRSMLSKGPNLELGEIDDCVEFDLRCRSDAMFIEMHSRRYFDGELIATGGSEGRPYQSDAGCRRAISSTYTLSTRVAYKACGTHAEAPGMYSNMLFVKYGDSKLITFRDRLIKVACRIHKADDIQVGYQLRIDNNGTTPETKVVVGTPPDPKFQLLVYDEQQKKTDQVGVGETGYVEISLLNPDEFGEKTVELDVTSLVAEDELGKVKVELLDEQGCPTDTRITGNVERLPDGRVQAKINFFGFAIGSHVVYRALVKPCFQHCYHLCSNTTRRMKRSAPAKAFSVESDQYEVKGSVALYNESTGKFHGAEPNKIDYTTVQFTTNSFPSVMAEKVANPLVRCFADGNIACSVSMTLVVLQAIVLAVCSFMLFLCCKRLKQRHASRLVHASETQLIVPVESANAAHNPWSTVEL